MKHMSKIFLLPLLVLITLSCSNEINEKPNILFLIAEDVSPVFGCYGNAYATTPKIDRLASESLLFTKALTTAPICAPSRSCLATGMYATTLGTQHLRSDVPFPDELKTLPELMSEAGYFTHIRGKTDYNFSPDGLWEFWDQTYTPWRNQEDDRPFFSYMNIGPSHEGSAVRDDRNKELTKNLDPSLYHDPNTVPIPPYYPDTPEIRRILSNYYNVFTVLDQNIGHVLEELEKDGLSDETIVIFIADHGNGLPRYKRWLYRTGLNVPMIVHAPEKYQHLIRDYQAGLKSDALISMIDMVPTLLKIAGAEIPDTMQGNPLFDPQDNYQREYAFGARDRADDMFEMSRAVTDGRYFYVRNFTPHYPYIQPGVIFNDTKNIFKELRIQHDAGKLNEEQEKLYQPKAIEELYDWESDPYELTNLASDPEFEEIKMRLKNELHKWMVRTKDLGLLPEAEYMLLSQGSSPYKYARLSGKFKVEQILTAAEMVGVADEAAIRQNLGDNESGVRYWGIIGLMQFDDIGEESLSSLKKLLDDDSPSVQIAAAEALCGFGPFPEAVDALGRNVKDDRPWVALQAARSIQLIGDQARPLIPIMYEVLDKNLAGPGATHRKYQDFNFAAFTSWALEWALLKLGEDVEVN